MMYYINMLYIIFIYNIDTLFKIYQKINHVEDELTAWIPYTYDIVYHTLFDILYHATIHIV